MFIRCENFRSSDERGLARLLEAALPNPAGGRGTIAIIGAGLAGLACARVLALHHASVHLFDKGRNPGGRCATRTSRATPDWQLDHGVPYFAGCDSGFTYWLRQLERQGVLTRWSVGEKIRCIGSPLESSGEANANASDGGDYLVGNPNNVALAQHLARSLHLRLDMRIESVEHTQGQGWFMESGKERFGPYTNLIVTVPTPQLKALIPDVDLGEFEVDFDPAHVLLLGFEQPLAVPWDAARLEHPTLSWVSRETSKPHRSGSSGENWVVHSTAAWSREHLEEAPGSLTPALLSAFQSAVGVRDVPSRTQVHRWRFSQVPSSSSSSSSSNPAPVKGGALWDAQRQLGLCADWVGGGGVEGAVLSGVQLALALLKEHKCASPAL